MAAREADLIWIRRVLKVVGVRIVLELQGIPCIPIETHPKPKQGIMASQSFGRPVENLHELEEAVATYASIAAMKLRSQHSLTLQVHVFLYTNFFHPHQPQYANSTTCTLAFPTAFTPDVIAAALTCIRHIYRTGYQSKKEVCRRDTPRRALSDRQYFGWETIPFRGLTEVGLGSL